MSAPVVKVMGLSWEVVETKCNNVKLVDHNNDSGKKLEDVRPVEPLVCFNLEVASARMKILEVQVKNNDGKYANRVDETAQVKV